MPSVPLSGEKQLPKGRRTIEDLKELLIKNSTEDKKTGCLIYIRRKNKQGYGYVGHNNKDILAHRAAWMAQNGPIPIGIQVCHSCDNPSCINISHLFLGTNKENQMDCSAKGRRKKFRVIHCKFGHEYNIFNTGIKKSSLRRYCRECIRIRSNLRRRSMGVKEGKPHGPHLKGRKAQEHYLL